MRNLEIGLTKRFRNRLAKLDAQVQGEVWTAAAKVIEGHTSVHVHKLSNDFVAFGVNRNALRVICLREGPSLMLVHVDAHDAAYAWCDRNKAVRVGNAVRVVPLASSDEDGAEAADDADRVGPLGAIRDRVFGRFGVTPGLATVLRRVPDEDRLIELAAHLTPPPLGSALLDLALDPDSAGEALMTYEHAMRAWEEGRSKQATLSEALADPVNADAVMVLPPGQKALQTALRGDLGDWRLFLHPSQQRLVRRVGRGALKVTGGPGTGKTVVALHRARFLAEQLFGRDPRPVLLTTFGATLAEGLREMVTQLCADAPESADRIDVRTLTGVSQHLLAEAGKPHALIVEVEDAWNVALAHDTLGWSWRSYAAEREHVVGRTGSWSASQYVRAKRVGRGTRLDRAQKKAVWKVLEAFDAELARRGGGDDLALAREATRVVASGAVKVPWCAVVCDEVQDASAGELRLLAALTRAEKGKIRDNALFLCGDGYQRLYKAPVALSACGIEVRGRSRKLRLNYRTTEGIRRAAVDHVRGMPLDELDVVEGDEPTTLEGYRSLRGGPAPVVRDFADGEAEADWVASLVEGGLLVLARTRTYRDAVAERLRARGVAPVVLEGRGEVDPAAVTVCTLHRSKGLEAPRVVIVGRQLVPGRFPGGDAGERRLWERRERCLMYVGMTRARDWLGVCGAG